LGGRTVGQDLLGVVQKNEKEEEMLDIQKGEGYGSSKSQSAMEMKAMAIETIERTAEDFLGPAKRDRTGSGCDM
jgi:hypothetical protein